MNFQAQVTEKGLAVASHSQSPGDLVLSELCRMRLQDDLPFVFTSSRQYRLLLSCQWRQLSQLHYFCNKKGQKFFQSDVNFTFSSRGLIFLPLKKCFQWFVSFLISAVSKSSWEEFTCLVIALNDCKYAPCLIKPWVCSSQAAQMSNFGEESLFLLTHTACQSCFILSPEKSRNSSNS